MKRLSLTLILLFSVLTVMSGQEMPYSERMQEERFAIYYRVDKIDVDSTYLDNPENLKHIITYLEKSPRIDSITIYAWASPEGGYRRNQYLAIERAKAAKKFLLAHTPDSTHLNSEKIKISPEAENWQGLKEAVVANYQRKDRDKVISILNNTSISDETRKWRLQQLDKGRTWRYLIDNYMPELRAATWVCVWMPVIETVPRVKGLQDTTKFIAPEYPMPMKIFEQKEKKMIMAARTNLLVPGLNVGLEFPIKDNWSVGVDYWYPWAVSKKNKWCGEMLGLFVDAKYWITGEQYKWTKSDRLQGHAIGVYGGVGYYDYQNINEGYQGEYVDLGVDYTFGLPVGPAHNKWMRIEFNLGVGWIRTYARHYVPSDDFSQLIKDPSVKNLVFDFFGPTRASVSFLLPIKVQYRKGGER